MAHETEAEVHLSTRPRSAHPPTTCGRSGHCAMVNAQGGSARFTDVHTIPCPGASGMGRYEVLQDGEDATYPAPVRTRGLIQAVDGVLAQVPVASACQRHVLDWFPTFSKYDFSCIGVASVDGRGPIRMNTGGDAATFKLRYSPKGAIRNEKAFAATALVMAAASLACLINAIIWTVVSVGAAALSIIPGEHWRFLSFSSSIAMLAISGAHWVIYWWCCRHPGLLQTRG